MLSDTLLLTRSEVERLLDHQAVLIGLRSAFAAYSLQRTIPAQRARSPLPGPGGAMILFPGLVPGIPVTAVGSVAGAAADAEVIAAATWSHSPFLFPGMVQAGAHITTLGPDEPGN